MVAIPATKLRSHTSHALTRIAVSWAEVIGAAAVFIGASADKASASPDCRPEFFQAFRQLAREGVRPGAKIEIVTPLLAMRKWEIVKRGAELGAPLGRTWSCYQFEEEACGVCDACRLRRLAFAEAGLRDPIAYRVRIET